MSNTSLPRQTKNSTTKTEGDGIEHHHGENFLHLWSTFYSQAVVLTSQNTSSGSFKNDTCTNNTVNEENLNITTTKHNQHVLVALDTITKLIFGLDGKKKALVAVHGGGALELVVSLIRSTDVLIPSITHSIKTNVEPEEYKRNLSSQQQPLHHSIMLSSVKAIKSCVIRNPIGRGRCRSSGIIILLENILELTIVEGNEGLVEEAFTALAAICLGDDFNALQASSQIEKYLTPATKLYPSQNGMHQKILYLKMLFDTVRKEQSKLFEYLQQEQEKISAEASFYQEIIQAELLVRTKNLNSNVHELNYPEDKDHYNKAVNQIQKYLNHTSLLDNLNRELRCKRAALLLHSSDAKGCFEDTSFLLSTNTDSSTSRIEWLKLHLKALMQLDRTEEAGEVIGKLKVLCPGDEEVMRLLGTLNI